MPENSLERLDIKRILDGLQDLVYVTNCNGIIVDANEAFARLFHYKSKDEIKGKPIREFYVEPEHRSLFEKTLQERGGRVVNYFVYVKRVLDTPPTNFFLSVDSNWIDGEKKKGIEGTGRDVSDLVHFLGVFFQLNEEGQIIFCSPSFSTLFGSADPVDLIGKKIDVVIPFDDIRRCADLEDHCTLKRDSQILRASVNKIRHDILGKEEIVGYQGTFEDITEAEKARRDIEESHRIQEFLVDQSQDGVYLIQGEFFKMVNPSFCSLSEYSEDELLNYKYINLVGSEHQTLVKSNVEKKLRGETIEPYEFMLITRTGRERVVRAFSGYCKVNGIDSVYGYIRDIGSEINLSREIEKRTEEKIELLDTAVHEMEGPTNAIRLKAERIKIGIQQNKISFERMNQKLDDIDQLCQFLLMLQANINYSGVDSIGGMEEKDFYLLKSELVEQAAYYTLPAIRNRGFPYTSIELSLSGAPSYIEVNKYHFLQIFFNLFGNAIKYAKPNPREFKVTVNSDYSITDGLKLLINDWGIGLEPKDGERIFDKGERGKNSQHISGKGLGLWVVKRILGAYNGKIKVKNFKNPTTFEMMLPSRLLFLKRPKEDA